LRVISESVHLGLYLTYLVFQQFITVMLILVLASLVLVLVLVLVSLVLVLVLVLAGPVLDKSYSFSMQHAFHCTDCDLLI